MTTDEPPATTPPATTPDDTVPPAPSCKPGSSAPAGGWFTDITAESGLADVIGIRIRAADLNGDGLPDLYVHGGNSKRDTKEAPGKRLFLNRGNGKFEDVTGDSGLMDSRDGPGTGRLSNLAVFADVDNDGDLDIFDGTYIDDNTDAVPYEKDRSEIYLNDGTAHFTMAPRSKPSAQGAMPTAAAAFADYDRDGKIDLFTGTFYVGNEGGGSYLWKGLGDGTFDDVSSASKILRPPTNGNLQKFLAGENRKPAYGVTVCDVDDDGDPDFIVSGYGRSFNELWRNDNGVFTEIGMNTPFAADNNVDYKADNEFYHCWCSQPQNAGKCTPEESKAKVQCDRFSWTPGSDDQPARNAGNTFSTACVDLDNDGDLDFIHAEIHHWHIGESSDSSQIIRNDLVNGKPTFVRIPNDDRSLKQPRTIPDWNEGNISVGAFDVDNDGKKDIYLSSTDYPDTWGQLYHQQGDGSFRNVTDTAGAKVYHAVAYASIDIDGDGDLDLLVMTSGARCGGDKKCPPKPTMKVFRNDIGSKNNFVQLRLRGKGDGFSNAAAIGAKVTVVSGGVRQTQEVSGGYGHFGLQHDTMLTFGLGATCAIDAIEVRWPDKAGTVQRFEGVVANNVVDVIEGEPKVRYKKR
ncbi:MAG: CRTAC1 family protein [Deltaproteobacteria bacterium]|nr:CRTAC1 family protein [Deltaproteobacteria bacterium]